MLKFELCAVRQIAIVFVALLALIFSVTLAEAACIKNSAGLRAVLALPGAQKSGQRFCLAPGRYTDLVPNDFRDAFVGIDPARPVVFEPEDPANPPRLNMWMFLVGPANREKGVESGNVILRGLVFDVTDEPEMPIGQDGFRGHRNVVELGIGGITRNVLLDQIRVIGPLREARLGAEESKRILNGVISRQAYDVTVRNSRFEHILNAITLAGENILIEGNRMRRSWGDLVRITPQVVPDGCRETVGVTVRNNILYDDWSNHRMHPDVVHMFPDSNAPCSIRKVLIEGTLAFPGETGLRQPTRPTSMANTVPAPAPAVLPATPRVMHRLLGPGETKLPPAHCPEGRIDIGVQLDGSSPGPVTLRAVAGGRMSFYGKSADPLVLSTPWETWRLMCRPVNSGTWQLVRHQPGIQGVFTNALPGGASYQDITLRHNILWIPEGQAASFRAKGNKRIVIEQNSFLRPWPGDANGDGQANTYADGFHEHRPAAQILVTPGARVRGNIASPPLKEGAKYNDLAIRHDDGGRAAALRFDAAPGPRLMPTTPMEALALARPRSNGVLAGTTVGAVASDSKNDSYDWSWVADPW